MIVAVHNSSRVVAVLELTFRMSPPFQPLEPRSKGQDCLAYMYRLLATRYEYEQLCSHDRSDCLRYICVCRSADTSGDLEAHASRCHDPLGEVISSSLGSQIAGGTGFAVSSRRECSRSCRCEDRAFLCLSSFREERNIERPIRSGCA
jgi:hypothetical protein